jgi:hypothetical protein
MKLKHLKETIEKYFAASAFAEQGEFDTAKEIIGVSSVKKEIHKNKHANRAHHGKLHRMPA